MTYKTRLIGAALAASLAATASIAFAEGTGPPTQSTDQQRSELQAKGTGLMTRMVEHCNAMMKHMSQ